MSTFEVLNRTVCVQLSATLWSPWRRLLDSDLELPSKYPPSQLATRGQIRVCAADVVDKLFAIKRAAERACEERCIRFLGGYATFDGRSERLIQELDALTSKFASEALAFRKALPGAVETWANQHEDWQAIIRAKAPAAITDAKRVQFSYQLFRVAPANTEDVNASENRGLAVVANGLSGQLFTEIVTAARKALKGSFQGKQRVSRRSLKVITNLRDKLDALSYIDAHCSTMIERIDRVLNSLPARGALADEHLSAVIGLLHVLSDEAGIRATPSNHLSDEDDELVGLVPDEGSDRNAEDPYQSGNDLHPNPKSVPEARVNVPEPVWF